MTTTPKATDLQALLERVEAASGPDRELEVLVCVALGIMPAITPWPPQMADGWTWELRPSADTQKVETWALHPTDKYSPNVFYGRAPEPFTASLDAALALAERVLPGSDWNVCHEEGELKAHLWPRGTYIGGHEGVAQTPALALVAAILKAMIATQGEKT